MMEYNRVELKRSVKRSMKGSGCMIVTLLFTVVVSAGTWLINTLLGGALTGRLGLSTMISYHIQAGYEVGEAVERAVLTLLSMGPGPLLSVIVGGMVLSIIVSLWQSAMAVGYEGWCLDMVRDAHPPVGRIFCALPRFVPVLVTRFLTGLFEVLWVIPVFLGYAAILFVAVFLDVPVLSGLLMAADVAALVVGVVWVTMRYALVDYVLLDKGLTGMDAIRESKRLMKDNIGKGWVLQVSFFGWYLLILAMTYIGIILAVIPIAGAYASGSTGGLIASSGFALVVILAVAAGTAILSLWIKPYTTGAMARFYDWACASADGPRGGSGHDGWSDPGDYTWNSGSSGPGAGTGSAPGGGLPPKPPRDDPWN